MFLAIVPGECLSILYRNAHSLHYLDSNFSLKLFKQYQYLKINCAIIDNGNSYQIARWHGISEALNWNIKTIQSVEWMNYFGVWPEDHAMMIEHWINVVKYRYPMMPAKPNNYEAILAACYLSDKNAKEEIGVYA